MIEQNNPFSIQQDSPLKDALKNDIRRYWNDKQPGQWYSKQKTGEKEYYDDIDYKRYNIFSPYIPKIAEFSEHKGEKVLEVGIGMGLDLKQYSKNGAICYGIDLTEGAVNKAKRVFEIYGLKAELQVMDAENLKFDDNTFDLVYSMGVLHHTPNTQKAINGICRILKPGGKAIVMLYSKSWQHYVIRVFYAGIIGRELFRMSMQELINKYSEAYGFSPLTKLYSRKEVKSFFTKFSQVDVSHWHYKVPDKNGIMQKIKSLKNRKYLQGNWVIKAIK